MKIINGQCVGYGELMNSLNQFLLSASFMPGSPPEPESTAVDITEIYAFTAPTFW